MSLFTIDTDKCKSDGICADQCPARVINFNGAGTFPFPSDNAEEVCLNCGHCVAVCPQGALSMKNMSPDNCQAVKKELLPSVEQVEHFLASRRSIRNYKEKQVDKDTILKMLNIANFAPSGHNTRPVNWMVIYDRKEVNRLSAIVIEWMRYMIKENPEIARQLSMSSVITTWENGYDRISRSAPHIIVAHGLKNLSTSQQACTIALSYLEQAAYSLGIGACWAGFFGAAASSYTPMKKQLNLPEGHKCFGAMLIGYPKYQYLRIPLREEPKISWLD